MKSIVDLIFKLKETNELKEPLKTYSGAFLLLSEDFERIWLARNTITSEVEKGRTKYHDSHYRNFQLDYKFSDQIFKMPDNAISEGDLYIIKINIFLLELILNHE